VKILGLDIGGGSYATAYFLESVPPCPREFTQSAEFAEFKIQYNQADLTAAMDLSPDCVVLEPTGGYEDIVIHWCQQRAIPYRLANTGRLATFRNDLGIPKADRYDAFALALFGLKKWEDRSAWVHPIELKELREQLLKRRALMQQKINLINQLRQRLHKECPEIQQFDQRRNWGDPITGVYRWCKGIQYKHYNILQGKVDQTCGIGISQFTKEIGSQIYDLEERAIAIENEVSEFLKQERFAPYLQAMQELGFSEQLAAWWLSRIYPFEQWMGEDGRPIEIKRLSKVKQKTVTIRQSLARFKCTLGAGTIPNTSGIRGEAIGRGGRKHSRKKGKGHNPEYFVVGDRYCRQSFILWAEKQIVTGSNTAEGSQILKDFYRKKKGEGKPYYKSLGNLHGYTATILFKKLVKALVH
jgi:hypothetical protein